MDGAWRIVDCSTMEGAIRSVRGGVVVCPVDADERRVPTKDVAVVLIGNGVALGPSVLQRLLGDDVVVLPCNWAGVPEAMCLPWSSHGRVGARHRAQAALSRPRTKNAWARIIRAKVGAQATALDALGRPGAGNLRRLAAQVRSGDPGNIEAQAARMYWSHLSPNLEFTRSPGSRTAGLNSALDYGYAVLRGHGVRAIAGAGLSPSLGLFHRGRSNAFNLVDDVIEPFRPVVDFAAMSLWPTYDLASSQNRRYLAAAMTRPFDHERRTGATVLMSLAQALGNYVEGGVDRLPVPNWEGPPDEPDPGF